MRRVVVTGLGIVSSIGNKAEVLRFAAQGRSGIAFSQEYQTLGFRRRSTGQCELEPTVIDRPQLLRFMGDAAAFSLPRR